MKNKKNIIIVLCTIFLIVVGIIIKNTMAYPYQVDWSKLKVGTYLDYTSVPADGFSDGYTLLAKYTGHDSDQVITIEKIPRWRIISVNQNSGTVDLISVTTTTQAITFKGAQGYNNGVYLLNDLCNKLYSNKKFNATARSINEYDFLSKLADANMYKNYVNIRENETTFTFGESVTYSEHGAYPVQAFNDNSDSDEIINSLSKNRELIEPENSISGSYTSAITIRNSDYKIDDWSASMYDYSNGNSETNDILFFDDESHVLNFWLATRSISAVEANQVLYGLGRVSGIVIKNNLGGSENWWSNKNTQRVRPIVTLSVNYINTSSGLGTKESPYLVTESNSDKIYVLFANQNLYNVVKNQIKNDVNFTSKDDNLRMEFTDTELAKVKKLDLSNLVFDDITGLDKFSSLEELYLNNNGISDISLLSNLINLKKLEIYGNAITDASALSGLTNLEYLDISRNNLVDSSSYSTTDKLKNLTNLEYLDISHNFLNTTIGLNNLNKLKYLNLFDNAITNYIGLNNLALLEELNIGENNEGGSSLSNLNIISSLNSLKKLNFSYNNDSNIVQFISNLTNLEILDLTKNGLNNENVTNKFNNLTNLKELNLGYNNLSSIQSFTNLSKLETLILNNNNYNNLNGIINNNSLVWPNLKKLAISYNHISSSTSGMSELINLSNNHNLVLNYEYITDTSNLPHIDSNGIKYVTYDDFGARCDGVYDDFIAIRNAHLFANKNGYEVRGTTGKTYHIFKYDEYPVMVYTNIDWQGANFVIHDELIDGKRERYQDLFRVVNTNKDDIVELNNPSWTINKNTKKINELADVISTLNVKGYEKYFVTVINYSKKQYIRYGEDANSGHSQQDSFIIDKNCNLLNDVIWDFNKISTVRIIPISKDRSYIKNGNFTTNSLISKSQTNYIRPNEYKEIYFRRGIFIYDSVNYDIQNIKHTLSEDVVSGDYNGFISIRDSANINLNNIELIERKVIDEGRSTYDFVANNVVNISLKNVKTTTYNDSNRWGVTGTNYCKDFVYENCQLNRIDAHEGVHNLTIKDSIVGFHGVETVGSGTMIIDNSTIIAGSLLYFRGDYGSFWDGDIYIKDTTFRHHSIWSWSMLYLNVDPIAMGHDFGYPVKLPNLYLENITFDNIYRQNENAMRIYALWDRQLAENVSANYWNDKIYINGFKFINTSVSDPKLIFSTLNLNGMNGNYVFTNVKFVDSEGNDLTHNLNINEEVKSSKSITMTATQNSTAQNEITIYKNNVVVVDKFKLNNTYGYNFEDSGKYKVVIDSKETTFNSKTGQKEFVFEIENLPNEPEEPIVEVVEPTCNNQIYDGTEKNLVNGTSNLYTYSNNVNQTQVGTYTITVTLKDKKTTVWKNSGNTDNLSLVCRITKAASFVTNDPKPDNKESKVEYRILEGDNQLYIKNEDIVIKASGDLTNFVEVRVDDIPLDKDNYSLGTDSIVITLMNSYLASLDSKTYKLSIIYNDGKIDTNFTVKKDDDSIETDSSQKFIEPQSKKSHNKTIILFMLIVMLTVLGFVLYKFVYKYDNKENGS